MGRVKNFTPQGGLDTPYKKASQIWDARIGGAMRRAQIMTYFSFFALGITMISLIITMGLMKKPRVIPYIVEIGADGKPVNYGRLLATAFDYTPSLATMRYHISKFITNFREVSSDIVVVKKNGLNAYRFVTPRGNAILTRYLREDNPLVNYESITRDVQIMNFNQIAGSDNSYLVVWKEMTYNLAGEIDEIETYRGTFVVVNKKEGISEQDLFYNPASVYIDTFVFAEDIAE